MKSTRVDGKRSAWRFGFLLIWSIRFPGGFSITSALLFWSRRTRELSFGTIVIFTFLTFGFLPYQYGLTVRSTSVLVQLRDHEGSGADRMVEELRTLSLQQLRRHDRVRVHRQVGEQRRVRLLQLDHESLWARRADGLDRVEQEAPAALELHRTDDRVAGVLGRLRRAVGELGLPQVEGVRG